MAGARRYGYQYETSPRKLEPDYDIQKNNYKKKKSTPVKSKAKPKPKKKAKYNFKPILYIAIGFTMLFTISYRNSLINESYNAKEKLKRELSVVQKENEQLKVNIESSLNLATVEKEASEQLGMQKLSNDQKVYINLQKKDYVQSGTDKIVIEEETESWFSKLLNTLLQVIK